MEATLGIDFGTSTTRVCLRPEGERPLPLPIGREAREYIPSVVALERGPDGPVVAAVGDSALALPDSEDLLVVENIKRYLMYRVHPADDAKVADWWDGEAKTVAAWGHRIDPLQLVGQIIEEALSRAVRQAGILGISITDAELRGLPAAIGCPAYSGYDLRKAMVEVASTLGLNGVTIADIVEEPNLAAMAFAGLRELAPTEFSDSRTVLVYDLGGGTFDVAIADVRPGQGPAQLTVLGAASLPFLGGADIDEALLDHLMPRIADEFRFDPREFEHALEPHERRRLLRAGRNLKEELTFAPNGSFTARQVGGAEVITLAVTRDEFESVLESTSIIESTLECTLRAYRRARMFLNRDDLGGFFMGMREGGYLGKPVWKLGLDDLARHITDVVVIGGSTSIPSLRRRLTEVFGQEKVITNGFLDPVTANSVGATLTKDGYLPAVLDRAPYRIEIECAGDVQTLYRPFEPFVEYVFFKAIMPAEKALSVDGIDLSRSKRATISVYDGSDNLVKSDEFATKRGSAAKFTIDDVGGIHVVVGAEELYADESPPWQHEAQRAILENRKEKKRREDEELRQRQNEILRRPAWLEND